MRREAAFYGKFRHYIAALFGAKVSACFEVKQTTTDSILFSCLEEHQREALLAAKHSFLTYKPSDESRGFKPFDFFHVAKVSAYVAIKYPKGFVLIDIDDFIEESASSKRRSLTWTRAQEIARFKEITKA